MRRIERRIRVQAGFTLIELLVVIAIIALLAAILFPVFARARENGRRAACQSNMKQIGLAFVQYTQDYDETTPIMGCWVTTNNFMESGASCSGSGNLTTQNLFTELLPYTKSTQIYVCPSATPDTTTPPNSISNTNYRPNGALFGNAETNKAAIKLAKYDETAKLIMLQEARTRGHRLWLSPYGGSATSDGWHNYSAGQEALSSLHFDGGNLLFLDGHVKWRKYDSLRSSDFGLSPDEAWTTTNGNTVYTRLY